MAVTIPWIRFLAHWGETAKIALLHLVGPFLASLARPSRLLPTVFYQQLTVANSAPSIVVMRKHVADLPLKIVLRAAQTVTQKAALDAIDAGRVVAGWKNGKLVEYGAGALPLVQTIRNESTSEDHLPDCSRP